MTGGAVGLITNVLREHARGGILFEDKKGLFYRCKCGEPTYVETGAPGFAEHVAAAVDAALGGLTREVSQATRQCSYPGGGGPCEGKNHGRWVSGWTTEEAS
jgi:hypothetical protein